MQPRVVIAGAGDLGRYIVEELIRDGTFGVVVIARKTKPWLEACHVKVIISDYSEESILQALDESGATALISVINCPYDQYESIHTTLLNACGRSKLCKRFIPGEWAGNIRDFPQLPRYYAISRTPFRAVLERSSGMQWTLLNCGWLMDYFLRVSQTHIHPITYFPIDANNWKAHIFGTGDEPQSWTCARNIGQAVVKLLGAREWDPVTYVAGDWGTFNDAIRVMEKSYGRPLPVEYGSSDAIQSVLDGHSNGGAIEVFAEAEMAEVYEWSLAGASACPHELTLTQRERFFKDVDFFTVETLLLHAKETDFV